MEASAQWAVRQRRKRPETVSAKRAARAPQARAATIERTDRRSRVSQFPAPGQKTAGSTAKKSSQRRAYGRTAASPKVDGGFLGEERTQKRRTGFVARLCARRPGTFPRVGWAGPACKAQTGTRPCPARNAAPETAQAGRNARAGQTGGFISLTHTTWDPSTCSILLRNPAHRHVPHARYSP